MKKKVLIVYYSQTGQLLRILEKLVLPLTNNPNIETEYLKIEMENDFPFPWSREEFFGSMPDSVQEKAHSIKSFKTKYKKYDLVILGYQVWFLSPSIPFASFLKSEEGKNLINDTKVITTIGGRNMWVMAQESVKKTLWKSNAKLVGNIALVDSAPNLISVVTIVYWLMYGKTDRLLNVFPKPGIKQEDINRCSDYGKEIENALLTNHYLYLQQKMVKLGAVRMKHNIVSMETKAKKVFKVWAKIINMSGKQGSFGRNTALFFFEFYLYFVILFLSPLVSILSTFAAMLGKKATTKKMAYYSSIKSI